MNFKSISGLFRHRHSYAGNIFEISYCFIRTVGHLELLYLRGHFCLEAGSLNKSPMTFARAAMFLDIFGDGSHRRRELFEQRLFKKQWRHAAYSRGRRLLMGDNGEFFRRNTRRARFRWPKEQFSRFFLK